MDKNDGGPAFPSGALDVVRDKVESPVHDGMTLRDWFAGHALAGLAATNAQSSPEHYALAAYMMADAMLAAREAPHAG